MDGWLLNDTYRQWINRVEIGGAKHGILSKMSKFANCKIMNISKNDIFGNLGI